MTIGRRLWTLSLGFIAALFGIGSFSLWNSGVLIDNLETITKVEMPAVSNATLVDMMHDAIRANAFRSIVASIEKDRVAQDETRQELDEYVKNIESYIATLEALPLKAKTKSEIVAARANIAVYIRAARGVSEQATAGRTEAAMAKLPELRESFERLEEDLETLGDGILAHAAESSSAAQRDGSRVQILSALLILVSALGGGVFATLMIRKLNGSLGKIGDGLGGESRQSLAVATELRATAVSLANSSAEQASALQETAASIDEINAMAKTTTENAARLEGAARSSLLAAERGKEAVTRMLEAVGSIDEGNRNVTEQIEQGNREIATVIAVIAEIEAKTKVINDIVFQTKLLSFNASVEAARAGDAGKGFAVVAAEVGNLARMSGTAAEEISELLRKSIARVESIITENERRVSGLVADGHGRLEVGRTAVGQCGEALNEIVTETGNVTGMISEISRAVSEQGQGVNEINKAIRLLDKATQDNSIGARRTGENAESMLRQAVEIRDLIGELELMTRGEKSAEPEAPLVETTGNVRLLRGGRSA